MDQSHIGSIFLKLKTKLFAGEIKRQRVQQIVLEETGLLFPIDAFVFKNASIAITGKPIQRNEIMLKKSVILEKIQQEQALKMYTDLE